MTPIRLVNPRGDSTPVAGRRSGASRWRYSASLAAGALLGLTWLEPRAFPLAWLGTWLLTFALLGQRPKYAFRYGLLAGEAGLWTAFHWLPATAAENLQVSLFTGGMLALLVITWDAFRVGIFAYLAAVIRPRGAGAIVIWPALWVAVEWLWPHIFPWRLGHSQAAWIELIQVAELGGVYTVSFLMIWVTASAATWLAAWQARRDAAAQPLRPVLWHVGACAACLVAALTWGHWRIGNIEREALRHPQLTVAMIQPGTTGGTASEICRAMSAEAQADAELVCWPESSIGDYSLDLTSLRDAAPARRNACCEPTNVSDRRPVPAMVTPLLCGGGSFVPGTESGGPFFNTAFLLDAEENVLGRYHKQVLAPWGEHVMGQEWIPGLRELFGIHAEYQPGNSAAPLELPGRAALGVLICYEDLLEGHARETVREGAQVLVNLNNLSAFGHGPALRQHQQLAQFRAVENRRYLLRCGTVGSTAVISATGKVVAQAPPHEPATLGHTVPLLQTRTLYTQWGDVWAIMCVAATSLWICATCSEVLARSLSMPLSIDQPQDGSLHVRRQFAHC
jgi:apolipoprotein N-acyltransferase